MVSFMWNLPQKKNKTNKICKLFPSGLTHRSSAPGCLSAVKAALAPGVSAGVTTRSPPQGAVTSIGHSTQHLYYTLMEPQKVPFYLDPFHAHHDLHADLPGPPCPLSQPREGPAAGGRGPWSRACSPPRSGFWAVTPTWASTQAAQKSSGGKHTYWETARSFLKKQGVKLPCDQASPLLGK